MSDQQREGALVQEWLVISPIVMWLFSGSPVEVNFILWRFDTQPQGWMELGPLDVQLLGWMEVEPSDVTNALHWLVIYPIVMWFFRGSSVEVNFI